MGPTSGYLKRRPRTLFEAQEQAAAKPIRIIDAVTGEEIGTAASAGEAVIKSAGRYVELRNGKTVLGRLGRRPEPSPRALVATGCTP